MKPRVVVVGSGFAGLWTARALENREVDVLVIDRNNYHTFLPLLYQVAASELGPTSIAYPVRSILRSASNVDFLLAEVRGLDLEARTVTAGKEPVSYDYLVLALGSREHFFGVEGAERHSFPLKTMDQAVALRHHVLTCFETAAHEKDPERRRALLTFAIVGGGPTGVEFAGALAELVHGPLLRDYRSVRADEVEILLLEATDRLLAGMPLELGIYAVDRLERRHVDVRLGVPVGKVSAESLVLADGTTIPTRTVVWSAGVQGAEGPESWGLPMARGGRIRVNDYLQLPGHPEVYVAGDLAWVEDEGEALPGVAPVAMQEGTHAAENVLRAVRSEELRPFRFRDPGLLAVIGRYSAAAYIWGRAFKGITAWVLWAVVHVAKLIGFRNRLLVLVNWAWNYLSFERAARLILPYRRAAPGPEPPVTEEGG